MLIRWIRNWYARRHHNRVITTYRDFGTVFGNALSYAYLGEPMVLERTMKGCFEYLDHLEELYSLLGYRIIPLGRWIDLGGYGVSIDDIWLVKREPGERPQFTNKEALDEIPRPSELLRLLEETDKPVEAIRRADGGYEYRIVE